MFHFLAQNLALRQLCKNEKNTYSKHLLGDDMEKAEKKAKTSNNMFKKSTNCHSNSNNH